MIIIHSVQHSLNVSVAIVPMAENFGRLFSAVNTVSYIYDCPYVIYDIYVWVWGDNISNGG